MHSSQPLLTTVGSTLYRLTSDQLMAHLPAQPCSNCCLNSPLEEGHLRVTSCLSLATPPPTRTGT